MIFSAKGATSERYPDMNIERRDLLKACCFGSALFLPGLVWATERASPNDASVAVADAHLETSIRASFGGGFSVLAHKQSDGQVYAEIEHVGNRYVVVSADLVDWKIMHSDGAL
jgi:hypothetical protein